MPVHAFFGDLPSCISWSARCSPSTVCACMSLSLVALSYASLCAANCSSSSEARSLRFSLIERSSMASTSQSCIACFAFSNSSLANANCEFRSSRSFDQFVVDRFDRLRSVDISSPCDLASDVNRSMVESFPWCAFFRLRLSSCNCSICDRADAKSAWNL